MKKHLIAMIGLLSVSMAQVWYAALTTASAAELPDIKPLFDYPVRDTCICLAPDKTYYLTGTTGHPTWWETNEGIRVWKSRDLKTWEPLGLVWSFEKNATWQKGNGKQRAIWAPEIHYFNQRSLPSHLCHIEHGRQTANSLRLHVRQRRLDLRPIRQHLPCHPARRPQHAVQGCARQLVVHLLRQRSAGALPRAARDTTHPY